MYQLSDKQIEFILDDIKKRGVEMEELRQDILDHVCCIIENELDENGNFEEFYQAAIPRFYKKELKEIENETKYLLQFKNYYAMKKIMLISGIFSVAAFVFGSIFKLMYWPGANILLVSAITVVSLVFMPVVFLLKAKEVNSNRERLITGIGIFALIIFCIGVMFKFQHWHGANILWLTAIGVSFLIFIPLYFFNGIKKQESRINTIVTTVLIVIATGIQFSLINIRPAKKQLELRMYSYIQSTELLKRLQSDYAKSVPLETENAKIVNDIQLDCEQIKGMIIQRSIGLTSIPFDFENKNIIMEEENLGNDFHEGGKGFKLFSTLKNDIQKFNDAKVNGSENYFPIEHSILAGGTDNLGSYSNIFVLNSIIQMQIYLLNVARS